MEKPKKKKVTVVNLIKKTEFSSLKLNWLESI